MPRLSADADLHLFDAFGSLQLSGGFDITQANGFAQPSSAASSLACERPTLTKVQLTLASLRGGLTYRFDPLLDHFWVPLVPYGRVGLVAASYAFSKGGEIEASPSQNPLGARFGVEGALGLMLALDFLDAIDPFTPDATARARANNVFDHTFVFVEGSWQDVRSFGHRGFDLSARDDFLKSGMPVSWKAGVAVELM